MQFSHQNIQDTEKVYKIKNERKERVLRWECVLKTYKALNKSEKVLFFASFKLLS